MVSIHKRGITACQVCDEKDFRPDGWCLLVDKDIYLEFLLDESKFTWFYSIADFGSRVMKAGYNVQTIRNYKNFIKHFGGASEIKHDVAETGCEYASNVDTWYPHKCEVIDRLDLKSGHRYRNYFYEVYNILAKAKKRVILKNHKQ